MTLHEINPLTDERWPDLVDRHPNASIFHTRSWLAALERTYGYEPVVFTTDAPGEALRNGLLFCRVASWMTGRRLVSLPFSDHCEPLVADAEVFASMVDALKLDAGQKRQKYIELRPTNTGAIGLGFERSQEFCLHVLDLRRGVDEVFAGFHKSCIQRVIRKAERNRVPCEVGRTEGLLQEFYRLHRLTRQRHRAPIQPIAWFRHLAEGFGDRFRIYGARQGGRLIAAILTLSHGGTWVYKYGCSDAAFNRAGATPLLFWNAIRDAHRNGATEFDFGRSDRDNPGLITFKDHLGAHKTTLAYFRYSQERPSVVSNRWKPGVARRAYGLVPGGVRDRIGSHLYKHFA